jgi:hypothetical protein
LILLLERFVRRVPWVIFIEFNLSVRLPVTIVTIYSVAGGVYHQRVVEQHGWMGKSGQRDRWLDRNSDS